MLSTSKATRLAVLTVIFCVGALFGAYSTSAQDAGNRKVRYEYKVIRNVLVRAKGGVSEKKAEEFLNQHGEEGWKFENVIFDGTRLTNLSSQFLIAHRVVE